MVFTLGKQGGASFVFLLFTSASLPLTVGMVQYVEAVEHGRKTETVQFIALTVFRELDIASVMSLIKNASSPAPNEAN